MMNWLNNTFIYLDGLFHQWGFHFYDIPALVLGLLAVLFGLSHWYRQNKRDKKHLKNMEDYLDDYRDELEGGVS